MGETLVLLDTFVRLAENIKQCLKLRHVKVFCRLTECLITTIDLQKKGVDLESNFAELEHENDPKEKISTTYQLTDIPKMLPFFKKQLVLVESFMKSKLPYLIAEWDLELQVSNCLDILDYMIYVYFWVLTRVWKNCYIFWDDMQRNTSNFLSGIDRS